MIARSWEEFRGTLAVDEDQVVAERDRILAEVRAQRLADLRKTQHLTRAEVAKGMGVSQRRVSQIERGELSRSEIGTIESYVAPIGGQVEVVAGFGDTRVVVA